MEVYALRKGIGAYSSGTRVEVVGPVTDPDESLELEVRVLNGGEYIIVPADHIVKLRKKVPNAAE